MKNKKLISFFKNVVWIFKDFGKTNISNCCIYEYGTTIYTQADDKNN